METLLQEEQGICEAAEEMEHNVGINESMVNWYDINFHSSFTNTAEFASRGNLLARDCENCKVNSNQWNSVPQKQHTYNREHSDQQTRQQQAQTHRYWVTSPMWGVSSDQRPLCLHGISCPMGNYCILRNEDEQDFSKCSSQDQQ